MSEIIKRLQESFVTVGIHRDAGAGEDGVTNVMKGVINEFGGGNVPERSFLRSTMSEKRKLYMGNIAKIAQAAIQGKYTPEQGMGRLGRLAEQDVKAKIVAIRFPENAESTKAQKGSSNPLIDNGDMVNSVRWKYENDN